MAVVLISLIGVMVSVVAAQDPDQGQVTWSEEVLCRRCHGDAAEGGWAGSVAGTDVTLEELTEQVRNGGRAMPAFSEAKISDEQLANIHAYLTSLEVVNTPTRNTFDLADDAHPGQALIVQKRCIACHGPNGPVGNFNRRAEVPTAAAVIRQLRTPRMNMPMFREDQVSDEEAAIIADFLASNYTPAIQPIPSPLDQALNQAGGAEALQGLTSLSIQSMGTMAGEDGTMQPYTSTLAYDVAGGNLHLDIYPTEDSELAQMSEIISGDSGVMMGDEEADLTADEVALRLLELRMLNPHLIVADLAADPAGVTDEGEVILDGSVHHVLTVDNETAPITIYINAGSGQIAKLTTTVDGQAYETFLYHWQPVGLGGAYAFPAELYLAIDGEIVYKEVRTALSVNPELDPALFETP
jgi:mono/diheme cytochrome c family protein